MTVIRRYDSYNRPPKIIQIGPDTSATDSHYVSDGNGGVFNWMKAQQDEEAAVRRRQARIEQERGEKQ